MVRLVITPLPSPRRCPVMLILEPEPHEAWREKLLGVVSPGLSEVIRKPLVSGIWNSDPRGELTLGRWLTLSAREDLSGGPNQILLELNAFKDQPTSGSPEHNSSFFPF